jgi:arginine decarboxylase
MYVPKYLFFTKGMGFHKEKTASLEIALRNAGIAQLNIMEVSSIFPPYCRIIEAKEGLSMLSPGEVTPCVLAKAYSNEPGRRIVASIGLALPQEEGKYGFLSAHHAYGETEDEGGEYAEDLAATMLANTLGIDFDVDKDYDERKEVFRMSGKIVETWHTTLGALGDDSSKWTSVVVAAVFVGSQKSGEGLL